MTASRTRSSVQRCRLGTRHSATSPRSAGASWRPEPSYPSRPSMKASGSSSVDWAMSNERARRAAAVHKQVHERKVGMAPEHARPREAHHLADAFTHLASIAMHLAVQARRLVRAEGAVDEALLAVGVELRARWAEQRGAAVPLPTKDGDHRIDRVPLAAQPPRELGHRPHLTIGRRPPAMTDVICGVYAFRRVAVAMSMYPDSRGLRASRARKAA